MNGANPHIVGGTALIVAFGVVRSWQSGQSIGKPIIGGVVVGLVLALLDAIGGPAQNLATAFMYIAVIAVLLASAGPIAALVQQVFPAQK